MSRSTQESDTEEGGTLAHAASTMKLDFPIEDAAMVIGCLALGTLSAIRVGVLPQNAGEVLAWPDFREPLRGRIPPEMMRALNGMDEIDLGSEFPVEKRMEYVESLIRRMSQALTETVARAYRLAWDSDSSPSADASGEHVSAGGRAYFEPVDQLLVLKRVASAYRVVKRRQQFADVWVTTGRIVGSLMTADPEEVRRQLSGLALQGLVEESETGQAWRPTARGWEVLDAPLSDAHGA